MLEVILELQGKREFNEIKDHIFRLLFILDSSEVPSYGQLSKNFVDFQNTAYVMLHLHSLLNLPYVSSIKELVSKCGAET